MARNRHRLCHLIGIFFLLLCSTISIDALKCPDGAPSPGREIICYTRSRDQDQLADALCSCTALVHQGHDLQSLDASDWKSLCSEAKEANPDVKCVLSIEDRYELLASSATTRRETVTRLVDIMKEVDGIELNVTIGSKERLVSFVKSLKDELVNKSLDRMILLALPTKPEDLAKQFELKDLSKYVDLFTVATHYLRDNDEANMTFHPSRLMGLFDMSNTDSLVDLISGMGAPKQKILISVPTSAYRFTLKKAEDTTPRSATVEERPSTIDRKKMCDIMSDGEWIVERDEDLTAPYAFKNTSWIAFEDETSLKIKGKYVILRELAGLALRDIESDLKNDCGISPVQAVYRAFTEMKRKTREVVLSSLEKDLKGTEIAYPRHVRSSDFRIVRVIDTAGKIRAVRENTQTAFGCSRQGYFVHPKSCNRFYRCVKFNQEIDDYSVFEFDCPAGLAFDERTEVCVWPGSLSKGSACPGSSEIEPVPRNRFRCPDHPGYFADPQNCRWFYACFDLGGPEMVPYEFRCPFGLVFDEHRLNCEWPWKVPNCNNHEHGDGHSVYHYGGSYGGPHDFASQGGVNGQGGLSGPVGYDGIHIGAHAGANYDGQIHNVHGAAYDEQNYNNGGRNGFEGQTFNTAGADGPESDQDSQKYNPPVSGYDGQIHNTGGTFDVGGYNGQMYNPPAEEGAGVGTQTYTGGDNSGPRYDGQAGPSFSGLGPNKQTYDDQSHNNFGKGTNSGQPVYNSGVNPSQNHNGQTYNTDVNKETQYHGPSYDGTNTQKGFGSGDNRYDGENYNTNNQGTNYGNIPIGGSGPLYNRPVQNEADCNDKNDYNNAGIEGGKVDVNNRFDVPNNNKEIHVNTDDYDDQRGVTATGIYNGQTAFNNGNVGTTIQFNSANAGTPHEINNLAGNSQTPTAFTNSAINFDKETISTLGYDEGKTSGYAGTTNKNIAGFNSGYGDDSSTKYNAGVTDNNIGINTFAGQTDIVNGVTSQNKLVTDGGFSTNLAVSNNNFGNTGFTRTPQAQNTNFNLFDTKSQTNYYTNNANTGISTIGFTNTIENQNNIGFIDNGRPTMYNSTFSANSGFPTSTIIPFAERQNTFKGLDNTGTPFNSVIYHSHVAMGLTSTEHFGTQYTNQAAKSFTPQGQNINTFTFNGRTPTMQNFNTATNIYDNSRTNSAGNRFVPAGITNFRDQKINTAYYNTNADVTNTYGNSDIIGSSLTSKNNEIVKLQGTTDSLDNYQNNENGLFKTDDFNNQKTVSNQNGNGFVSTFTKPPVQNLVTPASPNQNFNSQGPPVPGIVPTNNIIRPAVELDNSALFGPNFISSTTPIAPKSVNVPSTTLTPLQNTYRTNEYYDNGGRGTIRYNNGIITNKVTGNDIQDYRTSSYTSIPSSFLINAGNEENSQSTVQKFDSSDTQKLDQSVYTKEGFTKTGPTKTGITTAQVGGSGSYVIGTGIPRAKPNPQLIGANAFAGNFGTTESQTDFGAIGTTNFNARGSTTNFGTAGSTNFNAGGSRTNFGTAGTTNFGVGGSRPNFGTAGTTNFNAGGSRTNFGTAGTTNFNAGGSATAFGTTNLYSRDQTNFGETATTAEFGTSQLSSNLNTAAGTRTNNEGYSYPKPLVQLEVKGISTTPGAFQTNFFDSSTPTSKINDQSYINQNSLIPNIQNNQGFSSTISPIGYTTNQLENFKTTVYQVAKISPGVSTVQPVFDNGYSTVISSTPIPATISPTRQTYRPDNFVTTPKTYLDVGVSFGQGNDYAYGNTDYSDYTSNLDQGNFGQRVTGQFAANINANKNNELITSTQFYAQKDIGATDQTFQTNLATNFHNDVTVPTKVYLPSSTLVPEAGVTFRKPIVAAEFSRQNQSGRQSTISNSINRNAAGFMSRGSANRVLSNPVSVKFAAENLPSGVLINKVPTDYSSYSGSVNGIIKNQAFTSFTAQRSKEGFVNNQASENFSSRGSSNIRNNSPSGDYASRESLNRFSANQGLRNKVVNGEISSSSFSNQNQGFNGQTRTLIGSSVVTSIGGADFNNDIIRQSHNNFGRIQQSTTSQPEVTTYSGTFSRTRSRIQPNSFNERNQNKKVIIKLSDLHPLIIGKLGAECTCKADPFSMFRGPNRQTLPINSQNRGFVDLANYDESDIYIDVDSNKENEKEIEFLKNIPSNRLIKTSDGRFNDAIYDKNIVVTSRGDPISSTYIPPTTARPSSTTYLSPVKTSPTTYLPPTRVTNEYLPPAKKENSSPILRENQAQNKVLTRTQNRQPLLIRVEESNPNSRSVIARERSGKALFDKPDGSANDLRNTGKSFDRYGPGGLRSNDETLQGEPDCARPGLFRHPKFCNKFYACHWDSWKKRYTLHIFNCPVHLAFDSSAGACNYPTKGPACQDNKLLV